MNFMRISLLVLVGLIMTDCSGDRATPMVAAQMPKTLEPAWRVQPLKVTASIDDPQAIAAISTPQRSVFTSHSQPITVELTLPADELPRMVTFTPVQPYTTTLVETRRGDEPWTTARRISRMAWPERMYHIELEPSSEPMDVRLTMRWATDAMASGAMELADIAVFRLDENDAYDYWLGIGASISAASMQQSWFAEEMASQFGRDAVLFNRAYSGWTTETLRDYLPVFLDEHPRARYAIIHIGGNDVSINRPYPGGADVIEENIVDILEQLKARGITPILSRLTYRAYRWLPSVPPEENGSLPYVTNIYDRLIAEHTPRFYDQQAKRGIVDFYSYYRDHPEQIAGDGVHLTDEGSRNMIRLWVEGAGGVLYGKSAADR